MSVYLKVRGGPESGTNVEFDRSVITIGRSADNDLVLTDGLVSHRHGELTHHQDGFTYRDLRSRHGTLVKLDHVTVNLFDRSQPQELSLVPGAQLILGESIIHFSVTGAVESDSGPNLSADSPVAFEVPRSPTAVDKQVVTRSTIAIEALAQELKGKDPRLASIFKLSRLLNATSDLDEILNLLCDTTFEAFPTANFFAITLLPKPSSTQEGRIGEIRPLIQRQRIEDTRDDKTPLLSESLLKRVAKSRESVLFVRDEAGGDLSLSIIQARIQACLSAPLASERGLLGVMQTDTRGVGGLFSPEDLDLFTVMAGYAAFAIERVRLNESIQAMFDGFVSASVKAIDARDPSTAGHSDRVARYTIQLAQATLDTETGPLGEVRFTNDELTELRYAALLHDFGKIGVPENILVKAERLYPDVKRTVAQRFETIRTQFAVKTQRQLLDSLVSEGRAPTSSDLAQIDREIRAAGLKLDQTIAAIFKSQPQRAMPPEVFERLDELASSTFIDLRGIERPYFLPSELEHLLIPEGTLTGNEMELMKGHARLSREYLEQIPWSDALSHIPCIAGGHHEKLDGSGYPEGLSSDAIPVQVRILTICDIFDALTATDRPYRRAIAIDRALDILIAEADRGWLDADLTALFSTIVSPLVTPTVR